MRTVSSVSCQGQTRQRTHRAASDQSLKKVLIVDDEFLIRYSLQRFVEDEGFTALTADSGIRALKSLEEERPAIVILDIHLPDSNGLSLLKTMKEADPEITVIMITGLADIKSSVEAMKKGALDYLEKPIDFDKLKGMLDELCTAKQQAGQVSSGASAAGGNGDGPDQPAGKGGAFATLNLKSVEVEFIKKALETAHGNQRKAARMLDISRDTLRYRLKKLKIDSSLYRA